MKKVCILIFTLLLISKVGMSQSFNHYKVYNNKETGLVISLAGVVFTSAALLQGGYDYGTWQTTTLKGGVQVNNYVIPPFMKQTPRQLMFFTGVTLTITGLIHYTTH